MHAHWTAGGRTGAIAAAHAHRAAGRWPGVMGAVRTWLGAEKRRLANGNKKHPIVKGFGPSVAPEWIRAVVLEAKRTYVDETPGERGAGVAREPPSNEAQEPSVDQDVSPTVLHARNLGLLRREMTVIYTASVRRGGGRVGTRTTTATRQVFTARTGSMTYDLRGRSSVAVGERIAITGRGAVEARWRIYPHDCDRHGRVMAVDIVTMGFRDAHVAINKARHATRDVAAAVVRGGFMCPTVGSATTTPGVRHHGGKIQARVRNPNLGRVEVRAVLSDLSFTSHLIPGNESSFYWILDLSMTMRGVCPGRDVRACGHALDVRHRDGPRRRDGCLRWTRGRDADRRPSH